MPVDCKSQDERQAGVEKLAFLSFLYAVYPLGNGWSGEQRVA